MNFINKLMEKQTDYLMLSTYENIFKHKYKTENNKDIFGKYIPDGWDIINENTLIIIENKKDIKLKNQGKKQLIRYYSSITNKEQFEKIYLVLGLGSQEESFKYFIYQINNNKMISLNISLKEIHKENSINDIQIMNDKDIHSLNQYLYDNSINLPKSQKHYLFLSY